MATAAAAGAVLLAGLAACGSRTGLFSDESDLYGFGDASIRDGGGDARRDANTRDANEPDALPPLDAQPRPDANRLDCPDAAETLIYVITQNYELFSFNPTDRVFKPIGNIACPTSGTATPFSMAVDRKGIAYILFVDRAGGGNGPDDGKLFRVSTATAACLSTTFIPNQQGFLRFGMGFATNNVGPTESLFVAGSEQSTARGLASIDVSTFKLSKVGDFVPNISNAELTGTGDGRLYAFYTKNAQNDPPSFIGEIETDTGNVVAETRFNDVDLGQGWAFAAWGGDFYMFTAPNQNNSQVTRFRPSDGSVEVIASLPTIIVGAGVSTCAPSE